MIVTRNQKKQAASALVNVLGNLTNRYGVQGAQMLGRMARQYYDSRGAALPQASATGGGIRAIRAVPTKKRRKGRRKRRANRMLMSDTIPSIGADRIRVSLRDAIALNNTSAGVLSTYYQLANFYSTGYDFQTWLPRAATIAGAFRYFKVTRATFTYQPTQAYTTTGWVALGLDPDPSKGTAGNIGDIIRHDPSTAGDVKDRHMISWSPMDDSEDLDKLTNASGITTSPGNICQGVLQLNSSNNLASAANLGYLIYDIEVEFFGLQ